MTPSSLQEIKIQLRKFYNVVEPIVYHWENGQPHLMTMLVLLQNAAHDASDCVGYNHDKSVLELNAISSMMNGIAKYVDSHVEKWIAQEVEFTITLGQINKEYDKW